MPDQFPTEEEIAALAVLESHATEAPWAWEATGDKENCWGIGTALDANDQPIAGEIVEPYDEATGEFGGLPDIIDAVCTGEECLPNAAFIAASRNALPALLRAARFARKAAELLRSMEQVADDSFDCPCCLMLNANEEGRPIRTVQHDAECGLAKLLRELPDRKEST